MEKHIAQDCQSVDEPAKQEMSQLLMTKRLQVTCALPSSCNVHVIPFLSPFDQAETHCADVAEPQKHRTI